MPTPIIAPSILSADFADLGKSCQHMVANGPDWLHVDVMDGHFVPNISFGPMVVDAVKGAVPKTFLDCHMMVSNPKQWIEPIAKAGGDSYTFHVESTDDIPGVIQEIKKHGMKAAAALKPGTPVDVIYPYIDDLDMVLIMTVEPGFGGQKFMPDMMPKVEALRKRAPHLTIEVDGGLGLDNVEQAAKAGANAIVAGTSVFKAADPKKTIEQLRTAVADADKS